MDYIVIENWENLDSPQLVTNDDGETVVFNDLFSAGIEAYGCHEGIVVPLTNIVGLIKTLVESANDLDDSQREFIKEIIEYNE